MEKLLREDSASLRSRGTSQDSPGALDSLPVPDDEAAAILSTIIDLGRGALGWGRLPESEQFPMVCTFYLDLTDEGVPRELWMPCYRAAAKRRRQMMREGKQVGALASGELVCEWESIRHMHAELDKTRLLPETAVSVCPRCDGTGLERMPGGARRPGCKHEFADEMTAGQIVERDAALVKEKATEMREALSKMASVKAMPPERFTDKIIVTFTCTECRRKVSSDFGWNYHDRCGLRLPGPVRDGERLGCEGVMEVL